MLPHLLPLLQPQGWGQGGRDREEKDEKRFNVHLEEIKKTTKREIESRKQKASVIRKNSEGGRDEEKAHQCKRDGEGRKGAGS